MPNMSYVRMENTASDLKDVLDNWNETNSKSELRSRDQILELCRKIIRYYDEDYSLMKTEELGELEVKAIEYDKLKAKENQQ